MSFYINIEKVKSARFASFILVLFFYFFLNHQIVHAMELENPDKLQMISHYKDTSKNSLFQRDRWIVNVHEIIESTKSTVPSRMNRKTESNYNVFRDIDRLDSRIDRVIYDDSGKEIGHKKYQKLTKEGRSYNYSKAIVVSNEPALESNDLTSRTILNCAGASALALSGYMQGDLKPLSDILAEETTELTLLPSTQNINGYSTHVLEAKTPYGQYTVWVDPNCSYSPRRVVVERGPADIIGDKPVSASREPFYDSEGNIIPRPAYEHFSFVMDVTKIEEIEGSFYATEGTTTFSMTYDDGSIDELHTITRIEMIEFNPDFDKYPDAFVLNAPEGTQVYNGDFPADRLMWQNGEIVPVDIKPVPLLGKMLPDLNDLGVNNLQENISHKVVLLCFFDIEQRPSRNCITELNKRIQELSEKGIEIVVIQAAKVEQSEIDDWVKENDITMQVEKFQGDWEKARAEWGIEALPWMILTDKEHVVIAEGFSLNEIDEKLKLNSD